MGTRIKGRKDEFIRDLLGWVLPRILNVVGRIGVPMPRVEYKSGNIKGALDALKMGPGQPGGVVLDLVPDHVVVRTWNEVRIDMRVQEEQSEQEDLPSTSSNSRVRIHIDGIRLAVKDLGYFVSYGGRILQYSDQGLLDLGIGAPNVATQGLTLDIDLALDTIPSEPAPNSEAIQTSFDVLDVHVAIPGVRFKLNKSKHWILNKLFVQPLARPAISRVTASILEEKIHSGLEGLSKGLETFLSSARAKSRDRSRGKTPVKPGFMDYWDALLEIGSTAFGLSASEEEDDAEATGNPSDTFETYSKTTATMKGIIHTTISNAAGSSTQEGSSTEETAIAVGGGPILFSDKAGAYDSEDDGPSVEESLMQEVDSMVEQVEGIVGGAAESAAEVREGVIRAEDRRRRTITIERRKKGWKSQVFDFG
ncbi:hypothetical protein H0H93_004144 [Arthromyces matolae]|nr:hypothetical protein H0H93_004144 [Arthromyces matolae]